MKTFFAPAERLEREALSDEISAVTRNPVIDGLLNTVSGLLAVLNPQRQILALNDSFLEMLGIGDAQKTLGLRLGEAVGCIHRHAHEGGCGTSTYCATCGAAIAMVACQQCNAISEQLCALTVEQGDTPQDLFLRVRACPIRVDGRRLTLLFIQDITRQQQWEALGRVFFHDLTNIIYGLLGSSEILLKESAPAQQALAARIHRLSLRLAREVQMQKHLNQMADADDQPLLQTVTVDQLFNELTATFASHPAARNRKIDLDDRYRDFAFKSDYFLLARVLTNMVVNALEATDRGRSIRVRTEPDDRQIAFHVWNHQAIADTVVDRIFQRNISTKASSGRGLGTYSIKLFGERFLKGTITFTTSGAEGTTFSLHLPLTPGEPVGDNLHRLGKADAH